MQCALIKKKITENGGYCSPAQSCKALVIEKDGITITLDGSELAELYNLIKPVGTAPTMSNPELID
jgi:hypothetical protein